MDNSFYIGMSDPRNRSKFSIERNSELIGECEGCFLDESEDLIYIGFIRDEPETETKIKVGDWLVSDIGARYFVMDIRLDHEKDFSNYFRATACPEISRQTYEVLRAMASTASEQAISAKKGAAFSKVCAIISMVVSIVSVVMSVISFIFK